MTMSAPPGDHQHRRHLREQRRHHLYRGIAQRHLTAAANGVFQQTLEPAQHLRLGRQGLDGVNAPKGLDHEVLAALVLLGGLFHHLLQQQPLRHGDDREQPGQRQRHQHQFLPQEQDHRQIKKDEGKIHQRDERPPPHLVAQLIDSGQTLQIAAAAVLLEVGHGHPQKTGERMDMAAMLEPCGDAGGQAFTLIAQEDFQDDGGPHPQHQQVQGGDIGVGQDAVVDLQHGQRQGQGHAIDEQRSKAQFQQVTLSSHQLPGPRDWFPARGRPHVADPLSRCASLPSIWRHSVARRHLST